jgi:hypothetical protein
VSSIICWEEAGEIKCESEEERRARELEEKLKQHIEVKLKELFEQYELEVTIDVKTGRGVGRWRRKS